MSKLSKNKKKMDQQKNLLKRVHEDFLKYRRDKKVLVICNEEGEVENYFTKSDTKISLLSNQTSEIITLKQLAKLILSKNPDLIDSFQTLYEATGFSTEEYAEYFNIPLRTIQDWIYEKRKPADYLFNLMFYKLKEENIIQ